MKKNLFIAFEGIDGSGKSTQAKLLAEKLEQQGHKVYLTAEPTKGPVGTLLRSILTGKIEADQRTIAGLFLSDRFEHLLNKTDGIVKKLEEGYTVITDRYYFSSYAYHSVHVPMEWIIEANSLCAEILRPDLNVYIDISPEESMSRINKNRVSTELFETFDNLRKVREKYLEAFERLKEEEKVAVVQGGYSVEEIAGDIWKVVEALCR